MVKLRTSGDSFNENGLLHLLQALLMFKKHLSMACSLNNLFLPKYKTLTIIVFINNITGFLISFLFYVCFYNTGYLIYQYKNY